MAGTESKLIDAWFKSIKGSTIHIEADGGLTVGEVIEKKASGMMIIFCGERVPETMKWEEFCWMTVKEVSNLIPFKEKPIPAKKV